MKKCTELLKIIVENCGEVTKDYLEIGLDALLDGKVISDLPIVNTAYALLKLPISIHNAYYFQKIINCCYYMKDIPKIERSKFINKGMDKDEHFAEKFFLALEKIDELDKIPMLNRMILAYANDTIDYCTFRRFAIILENTFVEDLNYIEEVFNKEYFGGISAIALVASGLAQECIFNGNEHSDTDELYCLTSIGVQFYECVFTDRYNIVL